MWAERFMMFVLFLSTWAKEMSRIIWHIKTGFKWCYQNSVGVSSDAVGTDGKICLCIIYIHIMCMCICVWHLLMWYNVFLCLPVVWHVWVLLSYLSLHCMLMGACVSWPNLSTIYVCVHIGMCLSTYLYASVIKQSCLSSPLPLSFLFSPVSLLPLSFLLSPLSFSAPPSLSSPLLSPLLLIPVQPLAFSPERFSSQSWVNWISGFAAMGASLAITERNHNSIL